MSGKPSLALLLLLLHLAASSSPPAAPSGAPRTAPSGVPSGQVSAGHVAPLGDLGAAGPGAGAGAQVGGVARDDFGGRPPEGAPEDEGRNGTGTAKPSTSLYPSASAPSSESPLQTQNTTHGLGKTRGKVKKRKRHRVTMTTLPPHQRPKLFPSWTKYYDLFGELARLYEPEAELSASATGARTSNQDILSASSKKIVSQDKLIPGWKGELRDQIKTRRRRRRKKVKAEKKNVPAGLTSDVHVVSNKTFATNEPDVLKLPPENVNGTSKVTNQTKRRRRRRRKNGVSVGNITKNLMTAIVNGTQVVLITTPKSDMLYGTSGTAALKSTSDSKPNVESAVTVKRKERRKKPRLTATPIESSTQSLLQRLKAETTSNESFPTSIDLLLDTSTEDMSSPSKLYALGSHMEGLHGGSWEDFSKEDSSKENSSEEDSSEEFVVPNSLRLPEDMNPSELVEIVNRDLDDVVQEDQQEMSQLAREDEKESRQLEAEDAEEDRQMELDDQDEKSSAFPDTTDAPPDEVEEHYVSEHEDPPEPPTRPHYTHEGMWAKPPPDLDIDFIPQQTFTQVCLGPHEVYSGIVSYNGGSYHSEMS